MNEPIIIYAENIQKAWAQAVMQLANNHWSLWDLVVRIDNPRAINISIHNDFDQFAQNQNLIRPNMVAYTIFPYKLAKADRSFEELINGYDKYYNITRHMDHAGWGTYFKRMICYPMVKNSQLKYVNQLGNIISAIKNSERIMRAAYTMVIPQPGWENTKTRGAPCLNYVAVRQEPYKQGRQINLLAVYRNHDFRERAYGNYLGLGKLLEYIARETGSYCGSLTCISSHAYVDKARADLKALAKTIMEES